MLDALSLWERVGVRDQRSQETPAHLFLFFYASRPHPGPIPEGEGIRDLLTDNFLGDLFHDCQDNFASVDYVGLRREENENWRRHHLGTDVY